MFALEDLAPDNWCHLLELLGLGGIVYNIASHCELRSRQDDRLEFILDAGNASLFNDSHSAKLRLALENYFGQPLSVSLIQEVVQRETPAMRTARLASERQEEAVVAIQSSGRRYASKITLKKNRDGHWKIFNWSDLGIGVEPPVEVDDGDF